MNCLLTLTEKWCKEKLETVNVMSSLAVQDVYDICSENNRFTDHFACCESPSVSLVLHAKDTQYCPACCRLMCLGLYDLKTR
jgi:hypothetical protein